MTRFVLCTVLLLALPASATISYVRSAANWSGGTSSCAVSLATTNQHDLLVVWAEWQTSTTNTVTIATVKDTQNNPLLLAVGPTVQTVSNTAGQILYVNNLPSPGVSDGVNLSFSGSATVTSSACVIVEYSGADTVAPLDSVVSAYSASGTPSNFLDSGNVAPANSSLLLFGAGVSDAGAGAIIAGSGFTTSGLSGAVGTGGTGSAIVEYNASAITANNVLQRATACLGPIGSLTCNSDTGNWLMQMAVLRAATSGVVPTVQGGWQPVRPWQVLDATQFPGIDIGAQINAAYAYLPSVGGRIVVPPQLNGGCYAYTTPITFTTAGKFIILQGAGPGNSSTGPPGGVCLNYTPSIGTAITFDIDVAGIGSGNAMGAGMRDISLFGGSPICVSNGGCGGSAVGISTGTNGIGAGMFSNDRIAGFSRGFAVTDGSGWGIMWLNTSIVWNATGIYFDPPINHELDKFIGGIINVNGNGVEFAHPGELSIEDASIDANIDCGVTIDTGGDQSQLHTFGVHWENTDPSHVPQYVCGGSTLGSTIDITGGLAIDDAKSGTSTVPWFKAGIISAKGIILSSAGRHSTGSIFSGNTVLAGIDVVNQNQTPLSPLVNNATVTVFTQGGDGHYIPELNSPKFVYPETTAPSDIQVYGSDKCYGDSTAHAALCSFNADTPSQIARFVDIGRNFYTSGTVAPSPHSVFGTCTLGTNCSVTLTGSAAYSSATSYVCTAVDQTTIAAVQVNQTASNGFTITGNATDVIGFTCNGT